MKQTLSIIIVIVVGFLGFMVGYSTPPFMEVGFGVKGAATGSEQMTEDELKKYYEQLYQDEGSSGK